MKSLIDSVLSDKLLQKILSDKTIDLKFKNILIRDIVSPQRYTTKTKNMMLEYLEYDGSESWVHFMTDIEYNKNEAKILFNKFKQEKDRIKKLKLVESLSLTGSLKHTTEQEQKLFINTLWGNANKKKYIDFLFLTYYRN